jgi:pyruvate,water dikinase
MPTLNVVDPIHLPARIQGRQGAKEGIDPVQVLWLGDPAAHDRALVGGKAANLSRLAAGFRVPPGFAVVASDDEDAAAGPSSAVRASLARAYQEIAARLDTAAPAVAVRSSAVDEDGAEASFAGMHETYLGIAGLDALVQAVADCWTSAHSERALEYRRRNGLPVPDRPVPVLVQAMVPADVAGVAFSANPVTGSRDEVVINASWGLGESIVGGTVTPDTYVLCRPDLDVCDRDVAEKRRMTVALPGGSQEVEVPGPMRRMPALDDEQVREVGLLTVALEKVFGRPVDVELAWAKDKLHLLQARAITALAA